MNISSLINSWKTVFTTDDLRLLLDMQHPQSLRNYLSKLWKQDILRSLAYGVRWLREYNIYELVTKLKKNSYVSLETVLYKHGIIFQDYGQKLFACSDNTLTKKTTQYTVIYHKLKPALLFNPLGIEHQRTYSIATPERAVCDRLYLNPWYYFDDLSALSWTKLDQLSKLYPTSVSVALEKLHVQTKTA